MSNTQQQAKEKFLVLFNQYRTEIRPFPIEADEARSAHYRALINGFSTLATDQLTKEELEQMTYNQLKNLKKAYSSKQ